MFLPLKEGITASPYVTMQEYGSDVPCAYPIDNSHTEWEKWSRSQSSSPRPHLVQTFSISTQTIYTLANIWDQSICSLISHHRHSRIGRVVASGMWAHLPCLQNPANNRCSFIRHRAFSIYYPPFLPSSLTQ